jgi:hypothetical protein
MIRCYCCERRWPDSAGGTPGQGADPRVGQVEAVEEVDGLAAAGRAGALAFHERKGPERLNLIPPAVDWALGAAMLRLSEFLNRTGLLIGHNVWAS